MNQWVDAGMNRAYMHVIVTRIKKVVWDNSFFVRNHTNGQIFNCIRSATKNQVKERLACYLRLR